jgi:hypothetical protein
VPAVEAVAVATAVAGRLTVGVVSPAGLSVAELLTSHDLKLGPAWDAWLVFAAVEAGCPAVMLPAGGRRLDACVNVSEGLAT